jgi:pyruvate formate lyase activating enzyme
MLRMKARFMKTPTAPLAMFIPTSQHRATTDQGSALSCLCRAACFVVLTATIPIPGISRDGTYIAAQEVTDRLAKFATALRALDGGLTISGGEPMVQLAFTRRILAAAKKLGLHTAIETSGFLGDRADERYLSVLDLVLLDIKSSNPETYRAVTGRDLAPTLRFAERLASVGKPVWVRFTLVPGLTDDPANVDGIARFVAPMKNVEWVEVQPFHQLGAFKWDAMELEYKLARTAPPTPDLVERVIEQFRTAGCRAR